MATSKEQVKVLKKNLEEVEKAMDKVEQASYEVEVVETKEAPRAEVWEVYRFHCLQVWNEAFNQAGIEASFTLRRAKCLYYPLSIRALSSSSSKDDTASKEEDTGKDSPAKTLSFSDSPSKEAKEPKLLKRKQTQPREWPLMPPIPQPPPRTLPRRKKPLTRRTSRVKA